MSKKNKCGYSKQDLQIIRNFVKEINNEIVVKISPGKTWECQIPTYRLRLGKKKLDIEDFYWYNWFSQQDFFTDILINKNVFSLLHEIGHFETFDVNEWLDRNNKVPQLANEYYKGTLTYEELNYKYWELTNEYKATKWAIEFYKNNQEKCNELAKSVKFLHYFGKSVN